VPSPTPIPDSFALPFGKDATRSYDFSLTPEQIEEIVKFAMAAPDFLKVAADFWVEMLKDKTAADVLRDVLKAIKISSCPTFQITGSCKAYDSIKIEWYDPEVTQSAMPALTFDAKPRALDAIDGKCTCWVGEATPSGKCRSRVFLIKWWVTVSIKGIVSSFLAQINHITVCSPCCCQNDTGEIREEALSSRREDGTFKSPEITQGTSKASDAEGGGGKHKPSSESGRNP
jgi:hypothetical protein